MEQNKTRFYENYGKIREFVIRDTEPEKDEEILAISDLLFNTKTEKENKKAQEIEDIIKLLAKKKKIPIAIRREAILKGRKTIRKVLQALILKHLEKNDSDEHLRSTSI